MQSNDNSFVGNKLPKFSVSNTLHNVDAVDVYRQAEQMRVMPRQLSTGSSRGEMTVKGRIAVTDDNGDVRVSIGYNDGNFST